MHNKLHVGNLGLDVTEAQLRAMFGPYGTVGTACVATDRDTAQSRGFGFVEMASESEARAAIVGMHGKVTAGRVLTVSEANPNANLPVQPSRRRVLGGTRG